MLPLKMPRATILPFALTCALVASTAPAEDPRTWRVANNGVDESTCGTRHAPCRSVSQALANAGTGDTILVGPGRYGDLNGDGALGGIGEETGDCGIAVVCVRKAVQVLSREGAERTVIDAAGVPQTNGVAIRVDDVVFGSLDRGFTVQGASNIGILVQRSDAWIVDNIAVNNGSGGIGLLGATATGCAIIGNTALHNNLGFIVNAGDNRLEFNVAHSNSSTGYSLTGGEGNLLRNNAAIGNRRDGVVVGVGGSDHLIVRNAFVGNGSNGVNVLQQVTGLVVRKNNFFGNGAAISGSANIGLTNSSGSFVLATNNFWGTDMGPGPDPADEISTNSSSETDFVPFATRPFEIHTQDD